MTRPPDDKPRSGQRDDPRRGVHDDSPSSSTGAKRPTGVPPSRSGEDGPSSRGAARRTPLPTPPPGGGPKALDVGEAGDGRTTHGLTGDDGRYVSGAPDNEADDAPASGDDRPRDRDR